ncbi:MAG TPA: GAF domain-containing protein [Anaerolineales bacterium]
MDSERNTAEDKLAEQLKRLLLSIEASGQTVLSDPGDALLNSIAEAAARIFGAAAASILLVNEEQQVLEFKVASGPVGQSLVGTTYPLDKGIAGYVVTTGQPIATSHVSKDARFDREFAESTGYVPESILATPLLSGDRIIGVMEVLDKIHAASFGMQDMELLGMFARQAALAIDQAQQARKIEQALIQGLKRLASSDPSQDSSALLSVLEEASRDQGSMPDLLELARLFGEISELGEAERRACLQILGVFADYRRSSRHKFG